MKIFLFITTFLFGGGDMLFYAAKPVTIFSEKIELSGSVYYPSGDGPFPAVVMIHGSEYGVKKNFKDYAKFFARNGIVTLTYDKRGCGESGGDYLTSDFVDLAKDVVAAVEKLKHDPLVDSNRIGLWGISQGTWIELLADSLSSDISFLINVSGPAMTPAEHTLYALRKDMEADGFGESTIQNFLHIQQKLLRYFHDRKNWSEIVQHLSLLLLDQEARSAYDKGYLQHWIDLAGRGDQLPSLDKVKLNPWIRHHTFDPMPLYQNLSTPILLVYGTNDEVIDVETSVRRLLPIVKPASQLMIYPNAGHQMKINRFPGLFFSPVFPDGYLETMAAFVKNQSTEKQP